ncbi:hypothetical protein TREMEDRAFT_63874 [Tremella mesenterica DSM 1558]|uniref:uncharacterized protein n=1 Tax=Tremella mesenterica (strain ATCC 24925 / CBS 8224 / DSM 1558 / NBRC 9311 / NRRL Y-6157 / RJB 2259-6 / UBC 559-6) TaxID=578456 RepID=UPI0003F4924E|nr:uncharacterized protein TREMEDRAFT_63874 [Tremella mesenterica DSM 1558]EIW67990.1 hypothetical protein TREMEDRAFT_63874 [Tremella mesenterica DSM 1558]
MPTLHTTTSPTSSSTSSSHASSSTHNIPTINIHPSRPHPNLPPPPPPDRLPPPKGRSLGAASRKGLKLRKKDREPLTNIIGKEGDEEEGWTLEGHVANGQHQSGRPSESLDRLSPMEKDQPLFDSQLTEVPPKEKRPSKGRALVKKTSQLFSRDRNRDRSGEGDSSGAVTPNSFTSINALDQRQTSYSSVTSNDSHSTTHSSFRIPANQPRPTSGGSRTRSPPPPPHAGHARRRSHDSQTSWTATSMSIRSRSSSIQDSNFEQLHPIPQRQMSSFSASVPTLSRQALPQPAPPGQRSTENFPTRMSTWFSHLLPSSSSSAVADSSSGSANGGPSGNPPSPARKQQSAAASFLNAARQKAVDGVRHLLDSEAQPDKCPDTIWVLGVGHPGWRPSTPTGRPLPLPPDPSVEERRMNSGTSNKLSPHTKHDAGLRPTAWTRRSKDPTSSTSPQKSITNLFSSSTLSLALPSTGSPSREGDPPSDSPGKAKKDKKEREVLRWPDQFYDDFKSRVWCTYRSQYAPILYIPHELLIPTPEAYYSAFGPPADMTVDLSRQSSATLPSLPSRPSTSPWNWARSEERGLTTDAGWGCMLRTGQSLLANALIHLHLGRDWRVPSQPQVPPTSAAHLAELEAYSSYVRILSWFLDDPSPLCPFSVHRIALIGKELGKEVGEWFGPSTAAGALKTLVNSFPPSGMAVATAVDSIVYKSDVYSASNLQSTGWSDESAPPRRQSSSSRSSTSWGNRAVLVLIGIRLGLDGVNPLYYESIKALFTFPQSVGIAGGRPSSSYYFVGTQANSLVYLDPHFTRPAVPLQVPPAASPKVEIPINPDYLPVEDQEEVVIVDSPSKTMSPDAKYKLDVVDVDDMSDSESDSSSPTQARHQRTVRPARRLSVNNHSDPLPSGLPQAIPTSNRVHETSSGLEDPFLASASTPRKASPTRAPTSPQQKSELAVEPQAAWYATAYSKAQLGTFHCDKVRKIPLSGLDPSMLLGFVCKDEADFEDFCSRVAQLPQKIFTIQEEPPCWGEGDDAGFESVSSGPDVSEPTLSDEAEVAELSEDIAAARLSASFDPPKEIANGVKDMTLPDQKKEGLTKKEDLEDEPTIIPLPPPMSTGMLVEKPSMGFGETQEDRSVKDKGMGEDVKRPRMTRKRTESWVDAMVEES